MLDKRELAYGRVAARDARCAITTGITGRSEVHFLEVFFPRTSVSLLILSLSLSNSFRNLICPRDSLGDTGGIFLSLLSLYSVEISLYL